MGIRVALGSLAAAMLAASAPIAAGNQVAPSLEPDLTEIEVLSEREMARKVFKDNLEELTDPLSVTETIPRFYEALCVKIAGLEPDQARFVASRIVATSRELGLAAPRSRCRANAVVIVVDDPERMYGKILKTRLDLLGILPFRDVHTRRLTDDVRGGRPVVWWSVLTAGNRQGATFNELGLPIARGMEASRTAAGLYTVKARAVVMYDADQLRGATLEQIADHAALHILGSPRRQINFGAVGLPSMLSLFEDGPGTAPAGLTDFDRAYLKGLYALGPGAFQSRVPRSVVTAYASQCEAERSDCRIKLAK